MSAARHELLGTKLSGQMGVDFWMGDSQPLDESAGLITPVSEGLRSLLTMF